MPHFNVPSRSPASSRTDARSQTWPRVAVLALVGIAAASCSDSARFDSNPYASNNTRPAPPQETTGSIAARPATNGRVVAQPLPALSRPATVAAGGGVASGAQGLGAYRPSTTHAVEVTGSVPERRVSPAKPSGVWTWDGGSPVTVGRGETVETIARRHHVPASAIIETNGFRSAADIRPGQRLVIPRYITSAAPPTPAAPPHRQVASARAMPAPQLTQPRTVTVDRTPPQSARMATQEQPSTATVTKSAEAAGALPTFRWPVRGRVITAFGASTNGATNDGINLAVPEGTPVKAADDGVVAYAGNELKGYGNLVLIRHSNGFVSAYAHASELLVKRGDNIKRGQVIAHAGQTGNVTSPQLHFEIRKGSTPVDPTKYLGGV